MVGVGWWKCCVLFVNLVMESRYWPDDWRRSYIVPLFKAGDEEVAGNYRGIAQGNCVDKVMTMVLAGRLSKFSENHILTEGQSREWIC